MKHKEINLSSASLDKKDIPVETTEIETPKKRTVLGEKIKRLVDKLDAWWKTAPKHKKILVIAIPAIILLGASSFFFYYTICVSRSA